MSTRGAVARNASSSATLDSWELRLEGLLNRSVVVLAQFRTSMTDTVRDPPPLRRPGPLPVAGRSTLPEIVLRAGCWPHDAGPRPRFSAANATAVTNGLANRFLIPLLHSTTGRRLGYRLAVVEYVGRRTGRHHQLVTMYVS